LGGGGRVEKKKRRGEIRERREEWNWLGELEQEENEEKQKIRTIKKEEENGKENSKGRTRRTTGER
jgi:hypothetical protein